MKKQIVMVGVILTAVVVQAVPFVGRPLGTAVEKAVAREVAERVAALTVKEDAARTMSSALAGVTAKQLMGAGAAVAVPLCAYAIADGHREVDMARAETIRRTGAAVAQEIPNHPELARQTMEVVEGGVGSPVVRIGRWFDQTLPWVCGAVGIVCLLYLAGFLLRAVAYFRHGTAAVSAIRPSKASAEPAVVDVV